MGKRGAGWVGGGVEWGGVGGGGVVVWNLLSAGGVPALCSQSVEA